MYSIIPMQELNEQKVVHKYICGGQKQDRKSQSGPQFDRKGG